MTSKQKVQKIIPSAKSSHDEDFYGKYYWQISYNSLKFGELPEYLQRRHFDEDLGSDGLSEERAWDNAWKRIQRLKKEDATIKSAVAKLTKAEIQAIYIGIEDKYIRPKRKKKTFDVY